MNGVARVLVGATYPVRFVDQKKFWVKQTSIRASELRRMVTTLENKIRRGEDTKTNRDNLENATRQLLEVEQLLKEFK